MVKRRQKLDSKCFRECIFCYEIKSTHFYAWIAQILFGATLSNYMRMNKFSMQIRPCVKRCFNFHHSFFPSGFLPMSRIQTNKQVSFFQKEKNCLLAGKQLSQNSRNLRATQLIRTQMSKQPHTNTHTHTPETPHLHTFPSHAWPAHQSFTRTARINCRCAESVTINSPPFSTRSHTACTVTQISTAATIRVKMNQFQPAEKEIFHRCKSQRSQIWDSHSFTA